MKRPPCLRAALRYRGRWGWCALALCPPDHLGVGGAHRAACRSPGKRPLGPWGHWQRRLPSRGDLLGQWGRAPAANVGVVLGAVSGLVGIDVDGREGEGLLRSLSGGDLPATLAFTTGRGFRLLYRLPPGAAVPSRHHGRGEGKVSVLGEGALTVMPPSRHASGRQYRWRAGCGPGMREAAPAPRWLGEGRPRANLHAEDGGPIPEGGRNSRLFRIACALRRFGVTEAEILVALTAVNRRCVPPLDLEELRGIARSAAKYPPAV